MQAHAIPGPWAAGERVLVCVDAASGGAASLVRYARAAWPTGCARPGRRCMSRRRARPACPRSDKDRLAGNLRLAEQLGGEAITLPGQNVAQEILRHAAANNVTHIVVGTPTKPRWRELVEGSVTA